MTVDTSNRISGHFEACARDLTPATERGAAQVLYAPVSADPDVTSNCSSVLSDIELSRAERFARHNDKALFIQRRAFRRFCGARVAGVSRPLAEIEFDEMENGRPVLSVLPDIWFSFSSCRFGFAAAWSRSHAIGVDCEDLTADLEAVELAQLFFSRAEAAAVEEPGGQASQLAFIHLWSLKEAALKSIGKGLPFGLDAFGFEQQPVLRVVHAPSGYGGPEKFSAHLVEGAEICTAMVIRGQA